MVADACPARYMPPSWTQLVRLQEKMLELLIVIGFLDDSKLKLGRDNIINIFAIATNRLISEVS